jgi:Mn2+/Fe2+ NRAMP family transporter
MFLNDRNSADRLRAQRMLFSLWMALAALVVIITMAAGLATTPHAAETVDMMTTSSIATAPISKASDRIFVVVLLTTGFLTLAIGGVVLTMTTIRESAPRKRIH